MAARLILFVCFATNYSMDFFHETFLLFCLYRAYCLPLLQQLKTSEVFGNEEDSLEARKPKRPRLLIIAPTRELVTQIKDVVKLLCHSIKLSSHALVGGQDYGKQRKALNRPVDVIVSTPGRLLQHWREGHVFFGDVRRAERRADSEKRGARSF